MTQRAECGACNALGSLQLGHQVSALGLIEFFGDVHYDLDIMLYRTANWSYLLIHCVFPLY
jgi:hypothetical protein